MAFFLFTVHFAAIYCITAISQKTVKVLHFEMQMKKFSVFISQKTSDIF